MLCLKKYCSANIVTTYVSTDQPKASQIRHTISKPGEPQNTLITRDITTQVTDIEIQL